jgi:hypothetical protein
VMIKALSHSLQKVQSNTTNSHVDYFGLSCWDYDRTSIIRIPCSYRRFRWTRIRGISSEWRSVVVGLAEARNLNNTLRG